MPIPPFVAELRRLERVCYVESRIAAQDDLRNKRLFRITPAGMQAITAWVHDAPVEPPVLKHGVLLRLWLGHLSSPDRLRQVVEQHRAQTEEVLATLGDDERKAEEEPDWAFPAMVLRWGERYYRNELELTDELLRELDQLEG